jgi:fatty-acid desaturase
MNMLKSPHFWKVWLPPHVLLLAGILAYGWSAGATLFAFVMYCLISGLGVAVGFHRFFSHKAFETSRVWEQLMLFFGNLACHGNAIFWLALHRGLHHRYSDEPKDPHSPSQHGWWHAYQGYAFTIKPSDVSLRNAIDFIRRADWQWSVKYYHRILWGVWAVALAVTPFIGPWFILGLAAAQVWAIHQEAMVNVLSHTRWFGYRNYETGDHSVNNPALGLLTWGQALHNNHHADAGNPDFGSRRWYEVDPSMFWVTLIRK